MRGVRRRGGVGWRDKEVCMGFTPDEGHDHAHGHGTGIKWLDIVVGVSAMIVSVTSLWVSDQHGKTMEKMVDQNERMVAANTLPMLQMFGSEFEDGANGPRFSENLKNVGVGPAIVDWFDLRYKTVSYGNAAAFLQACCLAPGEGKGKVAEGIFFSNVSGTVLPARETVKLLVATDKASDAVLARLRQSQADIDIHACYCSVLEECWITDFGRGRPKRVPQCVVPKDVNPW